MNGSANRLLLAAGVAAIGTLAYLGATASAQDHGRLSDRLSESDTRFMREAAQGGMAEVRLGELAVSHGASERVRNFGQRMIDDHSKANDNLKDIASRKGVTLPEGIGALHRATVERLSRLHGAAFDAAYIRNMKTDHQEDLLAFRREANNGRDRDVRRFAATTLPIIREHYAMVSRMSAWGGGMHAHRSTMRGM